MECLYVILLLSLDALDNAGEQFPGAKRMREAEVDEKSCATRLDDGGQ